MAIELRAMNAQDYEQLAELWDRSEGLSQLDSRSQVEQLLRCHPGLSFIAHQDQHIVAAILAGHDGRRGYLYHLAVDKDWRQQGVGRQLVKHCLEQLTTRGIPRCSVFVYEENKEASQFWKKLGWRNRSELKVFAMDLQPSAETSHHE